MLADDIQKLKDAGIDLDLPLTADTATLLDDPVWGPAPSSEYVLKDTIHALIEALIAAQPVTCAECSFQYAGADHRISCGHPASSGPHPVEDMTIYGCSLGRRA